MGKRTRDEVIYSRVDYRVKQEFESQPIKKPDISVYDGFKEKHEISENDDSLFYGATFDDFNREWQGIDAITDSSGTATAQNKPFPSPAEYRKLSLEERAKLLSPLSDDRMEELKKYQNRMGYTEDSMLHHHFSANENYCSLSLFNCLLQQFDRLIFG